METSKKILAKHLPEIDGYSFNTKDKIISAMEEFAESMCVSFGSYLLSEERDKRISMKTTRLNQLYEHLDHGDLLPYQMAELRAPESGGGKNSFKKIIWAIVALLVVTSAIFILKS